MECQKGYDNILNNGGDGMKYAFLEQCGRWLQDAWDDTSRYYKADDACSSFFGAGSHNCPTPLCRVGDKPGDDSYSSTRFAYAAYVSDGDLDYDEVYDCGICNCGSDNRSDCEYIITEVTSTDSCSDTLLNCTIDYESSSFQLFPLDDAYCGWSKSI